ncbi:MAG: bcp 1 [Xanthobacteraceae bacterium]|jgi:peroxiredoxin|nr:bcp 1 [Xanthobacteraceae bacterium]
MSTLHNPLVLPADLPVPQDDGAAAHLTGARWPDLALTGTDGATVHVSRLKGRTVIYAYPRTGVPGQALPDGWDAIPGARGCTPQSCAFRDHFGELRDLGVAQVYGLSTQDNAYQREVAERLHLPFAILSDADLALTRALNLPTFSVDGARSAKVDSGFASERAPNMSRDAFSSREPVSTSLENASTMTLLKRLTLIVDHGTITQVFYPVFPPDQSARQVIDWLKRIG